MLKKTVSLIVIIILIFTLCSCDAMTEIFTPGQSDGQDVAADVPVSAASEDAASETEEQEWMAAVSSNTIVQKDGITTAFIKEWHDTYTVNAAYPIIDGLDAVSEELNQFALDKISSYENSVSVDTDSDSEKPEFTMIYEPFLSEDTALSFKFVTYSDNGKEKIVNRIETFVFDKASGEKLMLSDLFKEDSNYLDEISAAAREKLSENELLNQFSDSGMMESGTAADEGNYSLFAIDDGSIVFFFNSGKIAPVEAGNFEVRIPFTELESIKESVIKGKSAINAPAVIVLPDSLKSGENDMTAFTLDGIDPMNDKVIALTFDDGPNPATTPTVLEALASVGGKATFFMVGQNAKEYPDTVKQVYDAGMEIGNHSYTHPDFYNMDYDGMVQELEKTNDAIQEATGKRPILFRAPYGNVTAEAAEQYGRISVYWTVDTLDWKNRDVQMNIDNTVGEAYDGALVLMHDIHPETAASIKGIVEDLSSKGYKFVTVSQLIQVMLARGQDPTWRLGRDSVTAKPAELSE